MYKAYSSEVALKGDEKLMLVHVCYVLGITYLELIKQPVWWIQFTMAYLAGKNQAESDKSKEKG